MDATKRKNIAVLVSGINQEYQNNIVKGIMNCAKDVGFDISVFECYGGVTEREKNDYGEYNIFSLLNTNHCDGIILLTNTMKLKHFVNLVLDNVKTVNVPIVSVDRELDNAFFVGTESYNALKNIVSHFINHHKFTNINFISGSLDNIEAVQRVRAYKDALAENNIPFNQEQVYYGDFNREDGIAGVTEFLNRSDKLPQAIVCANDEMALGAYEELTKRGIKIPEQICISGFDNTYDAQNNEVPITTVNRPLADVGYLALKKIADALAGKKVEQKSFLETTEIYNASCGCDQIYSFNPANQIYYSNMLSRVNKHINDSNRMSEDLTSSQSFEDVFEQMKKYVEKINCEEFYLCICEDWARDEKDLDVNNLTGFSQNYRIYGYSDKMMPMLAYKNGEFLKLPIFKTSDVMPLPISENDKGKVYILSPIHFLDRCFGYSIICNSDFAMEKSLLYHTWLMNISNALENIRKQNELKIVVNRLDKLSASDGLTGVLNRHGFFRYAKNAVSDCITKKCKMAIIYFDLDSLKFINDNFGHEEGDAAIKAVADTILGECRKEDLCARFGGDEFVFLGVNYSEERALEFCNTINKKLEKFNASSNRPYKVMTSYGYYIFTLQESGQLSEFINIADSRMYKNKYEKKKQSSLNINE